MLITVQDVRQENGADVTEVIGQVVATVLDDAVATDRRFSGREAEAVSLAWVRSQQDRERYAAAPADFPTPPGIPVEVPDAR